jgi:nucleoside-diphosphate-sugar epimerase
MTTILVTGSSGFLGSCIVNQALSDGYSVIGVDKKAPISPPQEFFTFLQKDINQLDFNEIPKLEFIVHTASSLPYGNSQDEFKNNNINAAISIAKFAKQSGAFLVEIGSSSVYGRPREVPVTRKTPTAPLDDYAKSKLQAEHEISEVLSPDRYAVIRPRTILGIGRSGIFDIFFGFVRKGYPLPIPNSGRQIIQFVHVQDLARLSLHLGKNQIEGIWPAASPDPKELRCYLGVLSNTYQIQIRYLPINQQLFSMVGSLAHRLRLTKFTPWHFGAFPHHNYVESTWVPRGFDYEYTCQDSFNDTYVSGKTTKKSIFGKMRLGKRI